MNNIKAKIIIFGNFYLITMLKISFIGAGSFVFGETVLTDILTFPALRKDTLICLEDIDLRRLDIIFRYIKKIIEDNPQELKDVKIEKTTNQKKAIEDAKYLINAIQVGWLDVMKYDFDIPLKYGVTQCVGDTLGPGGVFRFLRTVPALKSIIEDIKDIGYNIGKNGDKPLFMNYTNPMAMNTWYCNSLVPNSTIGLCHGVQDTARVLQAAAGVEEKDFNFFCAGINHMAWFLEVWYRKDHNSIWKDAYPKIKKELNENPKFSKSVKVRLDMMNACGYFMTESSGHLSEYLPYYRKRKDLLQKYKGINMFYSHLKHGSYYDLCVQLEGQMEKIYKRRINKPKLDIKKGENKPSTEYASHIINAMETNKPFRFNGNLINKQRSLITNLPNECCVEVPVFADSNGLHPQGGIELPTICQALCLSNIMVQKAAVEGVLELNKEKIFHAVLLDPNTASVCSPQEIRDMVDEMFEKETNWILQF
ncbi:MAG: alpha-glucosidase/alpha-galactosidase [Candidatus Thorarchaeota archaeon]